MDILPVLIPVRMGKQPASKLNLPNIRLLMNYDERRQQLAGTLKQQTTGTVRLDKTTSNVFRNRPNAQSESLLDVSQFNHVLNVDPQNNLIETEGMTTYEALVDQSLSHGVMPAVVPQLKSITIGGAVSGIGIESSSFRYGLPHESIGEMDVLLGSGEVVTCTPDNEHRDLFYGLANSYGTLGYILRLTVLAIPVKPYIQLTHIRFADADALFDAVRTWTERDIDFIDGTVFQPGKHYLTIGRFVDDAPYTSDYTWMDIYYQSIPTRSEDYLTVRDYLWRWDTDWFWCSKNLYVHNRPMRRLLGRKRLNSITYQKVMRWNTRWGITRRLGYLSGQHRESVIQDIDVPIDRAAEFLDFFHKEIGMRPVWICPVRQSVRDEQYPLFPMIAESMYVNFGFWGGVKTKMEMPTGHFNRLIEQKVTELGGIKSLYSDAYFDEAEFWSIYDGDTYAALKTKYDPDGRLKSLYQKCVLRQ